MIKPQAIPELSPPASPDRRDWAKLFQRTVIVLFLMIPAYAPVQFIVSRVFFHATILGRFPSDILIELRESVSVTNPARSIDWKHAQSAAGDCGLLWTAVDRPGMPEQLWFSRTGNGGVIWSKPVSLSPSAGPTRDEYPTVGDFIASKNYWMAIWITRSARSLLEPYSPSAWQIFFARSSDDGATWESPVALHASGRIPHEIYLANLASDADGTVLAMWSITIPEPPAAPSKTDAIARVGGSPRSQSDIQFTRSTDFGATWTPPEFLNETARNTGENDIAAKPYHGLDDHWMTVWTGKLDQSIVMTGRDWDILISHSTDGGSAWTAPRALNLDTGMSEDSEDGWPELTDDGSGHWVAVWERSRPRWFPEAYVARSSDDGFTWSAPLPIGLPGTFPRMFSASPRIQFIGNNKWLLALTVNPYQDARFAYLRSLSESHFFDSDVVLAISEDRGLTWGKPWRAYPGVMEARRSNDEYPELSGAADGTFHMVWDSSPRDGPWDRDRIRLLKGQMPDGAPLESKNPNSTPPPGRL